MIPDNRRRPINDLLGVPATVPARTTTPSRRSLLARCALLRRRRLGARRAAFGLHQGGMIRDRLVGIRHGEGRDGVVERPALARVARDRGRLARARVRARERAPAERRVVGERAAFADLADLAEPAVLQGAY